MIATMPSPHRITVYLPPEQLDILKQKADEQRRSASNLAAALILESLETPGYKESITFLKTLAKGEYPSDATIILAAQELGDIESDLLFKLRSQVVGKANDNLKKE